ncbi:M3 family oligoendopeptidase [Luteibaculum oceani]|uniref:M3 family oligoendopeptidase n=1 Tax=Luteibaculum oceani TaxID=1294296 RepID=A0A5C6V8M1_9FLAO|nr:M3 family oligoendopeptidase [Luteibaculum oceani]TXC81733.1 M3 family oligoendopeptidase [Luteibaculum oceani]
MEVVERKTRRFLPLDLKIEKWEDIAPFLEQLEERVIENAADLENFIFDLSEVEAVLEEAGAWRYIRMTCDTANKEYVDNYTYFINEIQPKIAPIGDRLNKKIQAAPGKERLPESLLYKNYFRNIAKDIEIYREENIALFTEISNLSKEFGAISGAMTVEWDGKELTMQQAGKLLKKTDRKIREEAYFKIQERRFEDREKLDGLFDKLVSKRQKVAENAGFENFRDYKFKSMGRFDYGVEDCKSFHESVKKHIVPLVGKMLEERREKLGVSSLKPWDLAVDPIGKEPLTPFTDGKELLEKSVNVFAKIDPYFSDCLKIMDKMGHLDLESRKGKAPGGYNYPLYEIGVPFIFMNAAGTHSDVITMMHEGGHAVHSFLTKDFKVTGFKSFPSEVAELASMSTELISMVAGWEDFYPNSDDLQRAIADQLERVLDVLPWVATIDKFQHWIYENPQHSEKDRNKAWIEIFKEFHPDVVDYSGCEKYLEKMWQKQMHLFEVPFYYIEYGFAQLGAIAVWMNYEKNPSETLEKFKKALSLGYTKTIPEIYKTAGIRFDFSPNYIKELASFVESKMQ